VFPLICDIPSSNPNPQVLPIATGHSERVRKSLQLDHGWFVVRSRCEDDDCDSSFNLADAEADIFNSGPWSRIPEDHRGGSAKLRRYLGELLCAKIYHEVSKLLDNVRVLLRGAESPREKLGESRSTLDDQRAFLLKITTKYNTLARRSLEGYGLIPGDSIPARGLIRKENACFTNEMRTRGHSFEFLKDQEWDEQCANMLNSIFMLEVEPKPSTAPRSDSVSEETTAQKRDVLSCHELLQRIKSVISYNRGTELPCFVNTDVVPILYKDQTSKWRSIAEEHLDRVALLTRSSAQLLVDEVCLQDGATTVLHQELSNIVTEFLEVAKRRALSLLRDYCTSDQQNPLHTTDPAFNERLTILRTVRLLQGLEVAMKDTRKQIDESNLGSVKEHARKFYDLCHPSVEQNTINDVHDALMVYYQV
jgi:hypothetical protein